VAGRGRNGRAPARTFRLLAPWHAVCVTSGCAQSTGFPSRMVKFVCISYKQELQGGLRGNKRIRAQCASPLCVRCFVGTERPFANYVDFASSEFRPLGENLMKTVTLLLAACAVVAFPLGTAAAGPCTVRQKSKM
jgi:hypothetical protein